VTIIKQRAFYNCSSLTSLTLGNSISIIEDAVFENCSSITSLTIPNSVTTIGGYAFSGAYLLSSLTLGNSLNSIGDHAFYQSFNLTSLSIPNSVVTIRSYAFNECLSLTSVTIGNAVTSIGSYAFQNCSDLVQLSLGQSVTSIGIYAFQNCSALTEVTFYRATPITINASVFNNVNRSNCCLVVQANSVSAYQAAPVWQTFNFTSCNTLAIEDFDINNNVSLYPNPTQNEMSIDLKDLNNTKLTVFDIYGKTILNQPLNETNTIDTSYLANGIYLFKIESDEGSITSKIIKN
jgi:hypothetical protein